MQAQNPEKFERVVPAKPQPVAPKLAAPKPAAPQPLGPAGTDALTKELIRKAEARENEDGFCARTNWPERDLQSLAAFFETARPGDVRHGRRTWEGSTLCAFNHALAVFVEDGQRCVRVRGWGCEVGAACKAQVVKACREKSGAWKPTVESGG